MIVQKSLIGKKTKMKWAQNFVMMKYSGVESFDRNRQDIKMIPDINVSK